MKAIIQLLGSIERFLAKVSMGLMTVLVIIDVFSREIFSKGFPWAQKSAVYLMIWGGFLGAIMISEKAGHLRPEIADKLWGQKRQWLFIRIQNFVSILFCALFIYASYTYVAESKDFADKSIILGIPMWILQLVIPYTFFSMLLRNVYFLFNPAMQLEVKKEYA
jgi:TRAP-type C4-dicarboxylate transport system permease small subunit